MAGISGGRLRTLALQGVATAVTALLIGGAAAALGQPLGDPTTAATELPTDGVTEGPTEGVTEGPTEQVTADPTEEVNEDPTEDVAEEPNEEVGDEPDGGHDGHRSAVSQAARGLLPPVGSCRNHGHWVATVAKGLTSCDDNPRPAKAQVDEPAKAKPAKAAKPARVSKPAKTLKAPKASAAHRAGGAAKAKASKGGKGH